MSLNSSIDDEEDDDFDFYSNATAQFKKIKEQKEKENAMKMKLLEKQLDEDESFTEEGGKNESIDVDKTTTDPTPRDAIIEIHESQSPQPSNIEECYDYPSNRRATRSSTRRGRGRRNTAVVSASTPMRNRRNSRKSSLDKGLEKLEAVAKKLKAVKHTDTVVLNDSPVLLDSDDEADNEEIVNVKVVWRHGEPFSFPIVKKKDIGSIYDFFAKRENVSIDHILLSNKEKVLSPHSTPLSIDYKVTDILEGGILQSVVKTSGGIQQDKDCIEVKVQQRNVKKPLIIQLHKSNDMNILAKKVASELGIDVEKLKFNFDGDVLDLEETVESLDLDGGECFDLVIS